MVRTAGGGTVGGLATTGGGAVAVDGLAGAGAGVATGGAGRWVAGWGALVVGAVAPRAVGTAGTRGIGGCAAGTSGGRAVCALESGAGVGAGDPLPEFWSGGTARVADEDVVVPPVGAGDATGESAAGVPLATSGGVVRHHALC